MRLAIAVAAVVLSAPLGPSAHAASGLINTRFDMGLDWYLDKPRADDPVYPGFHGALNANGRLVPRLHLLVAGSIDSYRYGGDQVRSQLFTVRCGLLAIPVDFDGGTSFVEATAGWARLHGGDGTALAAGLGYLAQYGRLGIGLFSRYMQVLVPSGWGSDVKALVFGVAASVVLVEPRRPPAPPPEPLKDADGDGVEDSKDRCPSSRRGAKVDEEGCEVKPAEPVVPEKAPASADSQEPEEKPPAEAGDAPPPAAAVPSDDDDQDGVPDHLDQCPRTTRGFPVDVLTGCPMLRRRFALPQVTFASLSARIGQESSGQLDELMLLLRDRPGARLKIKGHVASAKDQPARVLKRLARERAQVVRDLLVARGVSPKRLKVVAATELDIDEIEILVSGSTKVVKAKPPKGRPAAESAQVAEPPAQEQSAAALEPKAPPAPASPAPEPKASPVPASPAPAPKANE